MARTEERRDSRRAEWNQIRKDSEEKEGKKGQFKSRMGQTNWDSWLRKLTPLYRVALDTFLSSQTRVTPYFFLLYFIYTVYTTIVFMFVICVPSL